MSVRIEYHDVAPDAAEDATVTATGATSDSVPSAIPFGEGSQKFATLELNAWALDGSVVIQDGEPVSFWSSALSDANGDFQTAPTITITLGNRYTSQGISFVFRGDAWCNDLQIVWYQGNSVLDTKTFHPDAMTYFCENPVVAYDKLVITFNSMSLPNRRLKLDQILFGLIRIFYRDELRSGSVKILQEIDPTSRELAANAMDFTISSKEPIEFMFQWRQPIYAYDDSNLIGIFYVDDSNRISSRIYSVTCTDAIGILDNSPFPDTAYINAKNALTLAQEICEGYTVDMDTALQSKTVKGVIVGKSRRGALQQLCFAIGAVADTSGINGIKIRKLQTSDAKTIPPSRTRTGTTIRKAPIVTEVNLTAHSYSTRSAAGAEQVIINGVTYYDTQTVTTITNPDATASDKPQVVSVADATLISSTNVAEIAQLLYDELTRRDIVQLKFRIADETLGDLVEVSTPWGDTVEGHYIKGTLTLSSFVLSDSEVMGA